VTGRPEVDWARWFRRSVEESAYQAFGAEKWIKKLPDLIFLDRKCTIPLPIKMPSGPDVKYHRVLVALGAGAQCRAALGGSGSLMLNNRLRGAKAHTKPFMIGNVLPESGYVHVFDEFTLDVVMNEFDTISDFVAYLDAISKHLIRPIVPLAGS